MKLSDVVKDTREWKDLFYVVTDCLEAGKKAHDGGLYQVGLRLTRIVTALADIDISESDLETILP